MIWLQYPHARGRKGIIKLNIIIVKAIENVANNWTSALSS